MTNPVPTRSTRGCLTCKRRKKKCDEQRPQCERCTLGGFDCLGYEHLIEGSANLSTGCKRTDYQVALFDPNLPPNLMNNTSQLATGDALFMGGTFLPLVNQLSTQTQQHELSLLYFQKYSTGISPNPQLGPLERDSMIDLIVSQHTRLSERGQFRPFPFTFSTAIVARARSSNLTLKAMYLGARVIQALLDDRNRHICVGWLESFHRQISESQSSAGVVATYLGDYLSAYHDLSFIAFMLLNSPTGYSLLRKGVPIFLQLAAKSPEVWARDSAISISHALNPKRHEMARFVILDVILALAFGTAPLLNYDTTVHEKEFEHGIYNFLERVYSCPVILLIMLAAVNSARIARLANQKSPSCEDIGEIEDRIQSWRPTLDYSEKPCESITRLAIQECWRQSALIYMYMGMCGVDSGDERIQSLVSQVAQLASSIEAGSPFKPHICVPCLIAGVAARKEKHRTIFRQKILASQDIDARLLRGADFVFVLDHLWHGVAAEGAPITWEDYVHSRYVIMPVDF